MGINQILNEIERPQVGTAAVGPKTTKRKAESEPQGSTKRVTRRSPHEDAPLRSSQAGQRVSASLDGSSDRASPVGNTGTATSSLGNKLLGKISRTRPLSPPSLYRGSPSRRPVAGPTRSLEQPRPGTLASTITSKEPTAKAPPKKGSYLEIMARAQAGHAKLGNMGKIQHKPLEKGPSKRERVGMKTELARDAKREAARPGHRKMDAGSDNSTSRGGNSSVVSAVQSQGRHGNKFETGRQKGKGSQTEGLGDSKPKKAALATTGYQGTARPPPSGKNIAPGRTSATGLGSGDRSKSRPLPFTRPRRSRYDEDDEMDDFIDYDEDELDGDRHGYHRAQRYQQHSEDEDEDEDEDESDMEAGLSDIDQEERRTEARARQEDAEQAAIEARLKQQKEARKKAFQKSIGVKPMR